MAGDVYYAPFSCGIADWGGSEPTTIPAPKKLRAIPRKPVTIPVVDPTPPRRKINVKGK